MDFQTANEYFHNKFWAQQESFMAGRKMRDLIDGLPSVRFFGERDWEYFDKDMEKIPLNDRCLFVSCLFIGVLLDQAIFKYYNDAYKKVINNFPTFPKFGYCGFGPHNGNPFLVIARAGSDGKMRDELVELMPYFAKVFVDETVTSIERFFASEIKPADLFYKILHDEAYVLDGKGQGRETGLKDDVIVNTFKKEFEKYLAEKKYM